MHNHEELPESNKSASTRRSGHRQSKPDALPERICGSGSVRLCARASSEALAFHASSALVGARQAIHIAIHTLHATAPFTCASYIRCASVARYSSVARTLLCFATSCRAAPSSG